MCSLLLPILLSPQEAWNMQPKISQRLILVGRISKPLALTKIKLCPK